MTKEKITILDSLGIELNCLDDSVRNYVKSNDHLPLKILQEKLYSENLLPCTATMKVDERTMNHKNRLAGGASLALAECLAGYASNVLFCKDEEFATGMQVSANHILSVLENEVITAKADIIHRGAKTHVWNVDLFNSQGRLVSSVRVTNMIIKI